MKKIILLVHTHEQAAQLLPAARVAGRIGCSHLWIIYSPVLAIDPSQTTAEIDKEIATLAAAEKDAAGRGDYQTATERKGQRDVLLTNRSVEIRNAWKRIEPEARKTAVGKFMEPVLAELNPSRDPKGIAIRISSFPEHQEPREWIATLNEIKGVWSADMAPGEFAMMWPAALSELGTMKITGVDVAPSKVTTTTATIVAPAKVPVPATKIYDPAARRTELQGFQPTRIISLARTKGIKTKLKELPQLIEEILAKEGGTTAVLDPTLQ